MSVVTFEIDIMSKKLTYAEAKALIGYYNLDPEIFESDSSGYWYECSKADFLGEDTDSNDYYRLRRRHD